MALDGSGTSVIRNSEMSPSEPLDPKVNSELDTPSSVVSDPPMAINPVAESKAATAAARG